MTLPAPKRRATSQQDDGFDNGDFTFRPATKDQVQARVAIYGVSGSGKTWTSLALAHGLGERVAVIDTERGSSKKYVGQRGIHFDILQMSKYDPRDLIRVLSGAAQAGYGTVLIDSLTHYWKGSEGTLEQVDKAKSKYGGNAFAGWKDGTPLQNDMVDALLAYPGHVVTTMRAQTEWVQRTNENGRQEYVAIGTRPEQRKGIEYEFDVVGQMDIANTLTVLKSRCPALHERVLAKPDGSLIAKEILGWLNDGAQPIDAQQFIDRAKQAGTYQECLDLHREVDSHGLLATPCQDGDEATSLGDLIKARGTALKAS